MDDHRDVIAKRDMLISEIKAYLKKKCEEKGISLIKFESFNQGSYAMGTGVQPIRDEHDYDIDCGLLFEVSKEDYTSIQVKQWVYDALNSNEFRTVEWKKACIRVQYNEQGLPRFHVDFACYSNANEDNKTYLAKGTPTSVAENKKWEISEPKKLRSLVNDKFENNDECSQFKRAIRYMKRWKDEQFSSKNGRATGIALTALAYNGFLPVVKDAFTNTEEIDDLKAVKNFVNYILTKFSWWDSRIKVELPVPPANDLFVKMTDIQCATLKEKLENLKQVLINAENETDPHEACKILKKQFGDDFPIPEKEETGQNRKKAIAGTSESA
jgi:hypothetical protein